jgi:kinesin family protein 1
LTDDVWSDVHGYQYGGDQTDKTSQGTNGMDSPYLDEATKDLRGQLEAAKLDYENRLGALDDSEDAEDLRVEKDHMEHQLKVVKAQMKRLLDSRAKGLEDHDLEPFEPTIYTARQLRLIRKVITKWRAHRSFSMAETVLSSAVFVKEANVIR